MKYKRILKKIYKSQKRSFAFCFILHFWIELWMWLHRWVPALGLVLGQYANNNILFPSMWLPLAQSTHWNLNQSWELWWVSKDWIKWDWYWVNKCSVKVYLLVYMCMCLCVRVLQGAHSACVREHMCVCVQGEYVCAIFHVLEVNWAHSEGPWGQRRERNHTHSHKQSNQFVYQTQHLMVICECV